MSEADYKRDQEAVERIKEACDAVLQAWKNYKSALDAAEAQDLNVNDWGALQRPSDRATTQFSSVQDLELSIFFSVTRTIGVD